MGIGHQQEDGRDASDVRELLGVLPWFQASGLQPCSTALPSIPQNTTGGKWGTVEDLFATNVPWKAG